MSDTLFDERRLVSRVFRHWQEMATGRTLPSLEQIDPWLVGDDWSYCMLAALAAPDPARFLFVGANLLPPGTPSLDSEDVSQCPRESILGAMLNETERCLANAAPLLIAGTVAQRGAPVLFRAVVLPLASNGERIDGLFGAANFRALAAGEESHPVAVTVV